MTSPRRRQQPRERPPAPSKGKRLGELWSRLRGGKDEIASILGESTRRDGGGGQRPAQEVADRYEASWRDSICQGWEVTLSEDMGYIVTAKRPLTLEEVEAENGGVCEYCALRARHTTGAADARVCRHCARCFHFGCGSQVEGGDITHDPQDWTCRDCRHGDRYRLRVQEACRWYMVSWQDATEPAQQVRADFPGLVEEWEGRKIQRQAEDAARREARAEARKQARDALLPERRQGMRDPPDTQY
jgi:hypothetical protein